MEIELTNYKRLAATSVNSISFSEFSPEAVDQWIKEVKRATYEIKIKETTSTNGETFVNPLQKILGFLQQIVYHQGQDPRFQEQGDEDDFETRRLHNEIQSMLRFLGSVTMPNLIMHMKNIHTNAEVMCRCILDVLSYLLALDQSACFSFPTLFASCLLHMTKNWMGAVDTIMKHTCYYALPLVLLYPSGSAPSVAVSSPMNLSAMLMLIMDNPDCEMRHHMMIAGVLMRCKKNVCSDLLSVIAYGAERGRECALKVLLHYWPTENPLERFYAMDAYSNAPVCEFSKCSNNADYLCLESNCALKHSKNFSEDGKKKLFLLLCSDCNGKVHRVHNVNHKLVKIMTLIRDVKPNCELRLVCNKEEPYRRAEVTCFGEGCASIQDGFPVRMCMDCHMEQHAAHLDDPRHMYQVGPQNPWTCQDLTATSVLLEAMTKLLCATPFKSERRESRRVSTAPSVTHYHVTIKPSPKVFIMLQQYFTPDNIVDDPIRQEWFERILALVLEWLHVVHNLLEKMMDEGVAVGVASERARSYHGSLLINYQKTVEGVCVNHRDIHDLVVKNIIPWLKSVCANGNHECIATVLMPETPGHIQVGDMWDTPHTDIERYRRKLSLLVLVLQNHFLTEEATDLIYNEVMPHWMNLLVELRNSPGQMEQLKDLLLKIFPEEGSPIEQQMKRFGFIRAMFQSRDPSAARDPTAKQRALFWLQDLSRLNIIVPYTAHIFDDIFHKKTSGHAFKPSASLEAELPPMPLLRRESTGSVSGYESESPLVTQISQDGATPSNTQAIVNLNFALSKYIVMLDIWNSQLNLCSTTSKGMALLGFESFQRFACRMLEKDWESGHTTSDHIGSFNTCLFCQAFAMWFSLSSHITSYYLKDEQVQENIDGEQTTPPPRRGRPSRGFRSSSGKKKSIKEDEGDVPEVPKDLPKQYSRDRRQAVAVTHSQVQFDLDSCATPTKTVEDDQLLPQLYLLFRSCIQKLNSFYHPDSLVQVVQYIHLLVSRFHVLKLGINKEILLRDVHLLLKKLWKILEGNVSYLSQACVALLIACQEDSIVLEVTTPIDVEGSELAKTIRNGLSHKKWKNVVKTVGKLTNILQFITGIGFNEGGGASGSGHYRLKSHRFIGVVVATSFCKMTRLLYSKDSIVTTKVQYSLTNLKKDSIDVIQDCLFLLFVHVPLYRFTVLQTLSLLTAAVPEVTFISAPLLQRLLNAVDGLSHTKDPEEIYRYSTAAADRPARESNVSIISARAKESRPSTTSSSWSVPVGDDEFLSPDIVQLKCDSVSLLIRYITTASDFSDFQPEKQSKRGGGVTKGATENNNEEYLVGLLETHVCKRFHILPRELCQSRMFEMFLIQSYKMLDKNFKFCETKSLIPFVLRLLGYSVSPSLKEYPYIQTGLLIPVTSIIGFNYQPCPFTLSNLPSHLQPHWLRVIFVIIYKYAKVVVDSRDTIQCLQWCIEAIINTLQCSPHVCTEHATPPLNEPKPTRNPTIVPESPLSPVAEPSFTVGGRSQQQQGSALETVPEENGSTPVPRQPKMSTPVDPATAHPGVRPRVIHASSVASFTSSYASSLSFDQHMLQETQHNGTCLLCHAPTDVYSEEVVALSVLCLGTCAHHAPDLVSNSLVTSIIPCISKIVIPGNYYWQDSSAGDPPPGSGMAIAKQFLLTILTQFAERRMFVYLLRHDHNDQRDTVFSALATCLSRPMEEDNEEEEEEEEQLTLSSPLEYFLEDVVNSSHFMSEVTSQSIINISCYLEKIPEASASLFLKLPYLEIFLKKLKHPDSKKMLYSDDNFRCFLKIIIHLLKLSAAVHVPSKGSAPSSALLPPTLSAINQEFPDILVESLQYVHLPVGGLLTLAGEWFRAFLPFSHKRREGFRKQAITKILIEQFMHGLSIDSYILPQNLASLSQTLLLLLMGEYVYMGYIDALIPDQRVYALSLRPYQELVNLNSIVTSDSDNTGIERCFTESMDEALMYLALRQPRTTDREATIQVKLTIAQLVAHRISRGRAPEKLLERIINGFFNFDWFENKSSTNASKSGRGMSTSISTFTENNINSLQAIGWLLLGAMCHNVVNEAIKRTNAYGQLEGILTRECEVLVRMFHSVNNTMECLLGHVRSALEFLVKKPTFGYWGLKSILCFATICTVYLEMTVMGSQPEICYFWQQMMDRVIELPSKKGMRLCNEDIAGSFCEQVIIPLKRVRASCVSLLLPTWKRVFTLLQNIDDAELPDYKRVEEAPFEMWMREMLRNFVDLESKYLEK